jgi:succinate dehydrogenase/fumarate reductase cytochrome b subunit
MTLSSIFHGLFENLRWPLLAADDAETMSAKGDGSKPRQTVAVLTNVAHISAPFLSVFLVVHLSAPALANVGGSSLSSNVMLLGREYYQTGFGERYLLFIPLAAHVASSITKRIIDPRPASPRKITSTLSLAAYSALLVFLPIHYYTHRVSPTNPLPPIFAVGPAEVDYEFVKIGLARFPWRSWILYGGLVASVVVHAVEGAQIILASRFASRKIRMRPRTRNIIAGVAAVPILAGLWTLSKEPLMVFASLAERYEAAFARSWVYRF